MQHILIASTSAPSRETFAQFAEAIVEVGKSREFHVAGVMVTDGPGCANIVIRGHGLGFEKFGNAVTMALMPARWSKNNGNGFVEGYHCSR